MGRVGSEERMIPPSRLLLVALLTAVLALSPLPYGSVMPGAQLALRLAVCLALALAAFSASPGTLRRAWPIVGAMSALALLGVVQSLPLPGLVVGLLSPRHLELYRTAGGLHSDGSTLASLSLAPEASLSAALTWASLAAAFVAALVSGTSRRERRFLLFAVAAVVIVQVVWGLRQVVQEQAPRLHGTYVNPDHLALYLEIALAMTFAWSWWALTRFKKRGQGLEFRVGAAALPVALTMVVLAAIALTGSRAGIVGALIAWVVQISLLLFAKKRWRLAWLLPLPVVLAAGASFVVGRLQGLERLLSTSLYDVAWSARVEAWKASLGLFRTFPILGSGLGTFVEAFPLVQPAALTTRTWDHAHSDPLELLVTGGLVGTAILLVGLGFLVFQLQRVFRLGLRTEHRLAGLAGLGALAAVGFHELVDFGLTLPANSYTLVILMGAACATRLKVSRSRPSPADAPAPEQPSGRPGP